MMKVRAPRVLLAGTASGVGKTTIMCGLLTLLARRGLRVRACKCGPDYVDPTFYQRILGVPSSNLDTFLGDDAYVRAQVALGARDADVTVIEGAMGYYDGVSCGTQASAYDVARVTETPVVLVSDARGRALSAAAEIAGFMRFREPSRIRGVLLNRVSAGYAETLRAMVNRETNVPVLGCLPTLEGVRLEHRHLGLVRAPEIDDLLDRVAVVADALEDMLDIEMLVETAATAPDLECDPQGVPALADDAPVVAVARDEAFCFLYDDLSQTLERMGAKVAWFSPLHDHGLPAGTSGLYLCGGYPELWARGLSENVAMCEQVRNAIDNGMPTIAECGGFMYLHDCLVDDRDVPWPMVGVVHGTCRNQGHLVRFGYATLTATRDSLVARRGDRIPVHEFHYWDSDAHGDAFVARKPNRDASWECVVGTRTLYAGFPHLYLSAHLEVARRFVDACAAFGIGGGGVA
jgi:cobyrinic acid a,c-diamide synthase